MGASHSIALPSDTITLHSNPKPLAFSHTTQSRLQNPLLKFNPTNQIFQTLSKTMSQPSLVTPLNGGKVGVRETQEGSSTRPINVDGIDQELVEKMVYDALVWSSIHGLVVGDRSVQRSSTVPGVGMVHAPFALLPMPFPESQLKQAYELAPIFNELVDRVSLDAKFLQDSLSRTKKADPFTSRLLDIHSKMLEINKKEEIRLGLHRSDYMLDEQTKLLLQIEMNTISSSFAGLSGLVGKLHRSLLSHYGEFLGLDFKRIPDNASVSQFSAALARAWTEYNNPRAVVLFVVQAEERNMYDQHWLSVTLKEKYNISTIRKTLAEIDAEGKLLPDGTLVVGGQVIGIVYFRAGGKTMELFWLATWIDVSCFFWGSLYLANLACAIKSLPLCTQPCLCCSYLVNLTGDNMYHENAQIFPSFMPNYSFVPSMVVNLCVSFKYA